jgi:hypothetical protein
VLKRIVWLLVAFPTAVFLITLAVANRHAVRLVLDPFRPEQPVLSVMLPFYAYIFAALLAGVLVGGISTWVSQGHWRRSARRSSSDAKRWRVEAERLTREREAEIAGRAKELPAPGHRDAA